MDTEPGVQLIVTIICSVMASSGFWMYIQKRHETKDIKIELLIGLAHDRIMFLCSEYIKRGYITKEEYENLYEYLYKPYEKMGGNGSGSAKRIMTEVDKLPLHDHINKT